MSQKHNTNMLYFMKSLLGHIKPHNTNRHLSASQKHIKHIKSFITACYVPSMRMTQSRLSPSETGRRSRLQGRWFGSRICVASRSQWTIWPGIGLVWSGWQLGDEGWTRRRWAKRRGGWEIEEAKAFGKHNRRYGQGGSVGSSYCCRHGDSLWIRVWGFNYFNYF